MKPSELNDRHLNELLDKGSAAFDLEYEGVAVRGKFEGNRNPGLAEAIYNKSLQGWNEDETGSVEWIGHFSLLGRFIVAEDTLGFVDVVEFDTKAEARAEFTTIEDEYAAWDDGDDEA